MRDAIAFALGNFTLTFFVLGLLASAIALWRTLQPHVYQMVTAHNFALGNAGVIFCSDVLVPVIGLLFLWLQWRPASGQQRGFTHL
jgi:hypothetical protein